VRSLRSEPNPERPETIVFFYSLIGIRLRPCSAQASHGTGQLLRLAALLMLGLSAFGAQWLMAFVCG